MFCENYTSFKNMRQTYEQLIKNREKFWGLDKGFKFLDLLLLQLKKLPKTELSGNDSIKIYDYKEDSFFYVKCDIAKLDNFFMKMYLDFLVSDLSTEFEWYNKFYSTIFDFFDKNLALSLIKTLTQVFLKLSSEKNKIELKNLSFFLVEFFFSVTGDEVESKKVSSDLIECLLLNKLLILQDDGILSFSDPIMSYVFCVTSLKLPKIASKDLCLKYNCEYAVVNLSSLIDSYLIRLNSDFNLIKGIDIFLEKYPYLEQDVLNYSKRDINNIRIVYNKLDDFNFFIVNLFFFKKTLLNEYCFFTLVLSCFENYFFEPKLKNILISKNDPVLQLIYLT